MNVVSPASNALLLPLQVDEYLLILLPSSDVGKDSPMFLHSHDHIFHAFVSNTDNILWQFEYMCIMLTFSTVPGIL